MALYHIALIVLAAAFIPRYVLSDEELDAAFKLILTHSPELDSDHMSHLSSINQRESLTRAVQLVLDSYKLASETEDLANASFRRMDGLGNNLGNPMWGASLHPQLRYLPNDYEDGAQVPRYMTLNKTALLPSAREVSLKCFLPDSEVEEDGFLDKNISQLFMQFGQFLDHDIIFTEMEIGSECCADLNEDGTHPDMFVEDGPCFPLHIPSNDRYFNVSCVTNRRSFGEMKNGVREQINAVTSFVDASQVYGPSEILAAELRLFQDGLLDVEVKSNSDFPYLPLLGNYKCLKESMPVCPHAGDPRVNVYPGLTIMHTLFHREHNRLAKKLKEVNPHWDDERLFQEARKINIAINQIITYEEYLPKVLGDTVMDIIGLSKPYVYDPNVDASVSSAFGAAGFRFGHSQINGLLKVSNSEIYDTSEVYFRPHLGVDRGEGIIKNIVINQAKQKAQKTDEHFSTEVTDKLFLGVDAAGESFDLPALAVQRCRDHGLPSYLEFVDLCLNDLASKASSGGHACPVTQLNLPTCLADGIYQSVDDIDLFVGAMYETPVPGGLVGPTFAYIIGDQFYRLKFGDRFWYETPDQKIGFTSDQLANIKANTGMAHIICHNTIASNMHARPMETRRYWPKQSCDVYGDLDFSLWKE